jgi:hypothetical protein
MNVELLERVENLLVLTACQDEHGAFRFPGNYQGWPGLYVSRKDGSGSFWDRLRLAVQMALGEVSLIDKVSIEYVITPAIDLPDGREAALLLAKVSRADFIAPANWATLADILRSLPKTKNRVAYLKALQLLSGAHEQSIDAVEIDNASVNEIFQEALKH